MKTNETKKVYFTILVNGEFIEKEILRVKEGAKTLWKVQAPKGILTFNKKKDAMRCVEAFNKNL